MLSALQTIVNSIYSKMVFHNVGLGFDPSFILTLLTTLLPLIGSCKKKEDVPPADPKPMDLQATETHWQQAWDTHHVALNAYDDDTKDYDADVLRKAAKRIMKERKKNKSKITKTEAIRLAIASLDEARMNSVETLALAYEEHSKTAA